MPMDGLALKRLPVTIVAGFPGAGKTLTLERLAAVERLEGVSVMVLAASGPDELMREAARMACSGRADRLILEAEGEVEPLRLAALFEFRDDDGFSLGDVARIDGVVTVVDASRFLDDLSTDRDLEARGLADSGSETRYAARLLAEQIEFADLLVITEGNQLSRDGLERLTELLRHMNPRARVALADGELERAQWTGRREAMIRAGSIAGAALDVQPVRAQGLGRFGISSFIYRARRPFHPERLRAFLGAGWPGVLRSKGFFWLATRMDEIGSWSQAGPVWQVGRAGFWWAAVPDEVWRAHPANRMAGAEHWQEPFGDRRQEFLLVGVEMQRADLEAGFDRCLLTEGEFGSGVEAWRRLRDPFRTWSDGREWRVLRASLCEAAGFGSVATARSDLN